MYDASVLVVVSSVAFSHILRHWSIVVVGSVPHSGRECQVDVWVHAVEAAGDQGAPDVGGERQRVCCGGCESDRCI